MTDARLTENSKYILLLMCFSDSMEDANGSGYFLVDPVIHAGKMDDRISMDCIRCQTVLAKALGPFEEWQDRLRVAYETGYNMIHFTPIQELGASNSSYCIREQLALNSAFSKVSRSTQALSTIHRHHSVCRLIATAAYIRH